MSDSITPEALERLKALEQAATPVTDEQIRDLLALEGVATLRHWEESWAIRHMTLLPADRRLAIGALNALPELLDEIERLRAVVKRLPRTADGVAVTPDMRLWVVNERTGGIDRKRAPILRGPAMWYYAECYSTRAAAEAAVAWKQCVHLAEDELLEADESNRTYDSPKSLTPDEAQAKLEAVTAERDALRKRLAALMPLFQAAVEAAAKEKP